MEKEQFITFPSLSYLGELKREREQRFTEDKPKVTARDVCLRKRQLSLGVSNAHYNFFLLNQFYNLCRGKNDVCFKGLDLVPDNGPLLFVMKHRGFSDITCHGMGHALIRSTIHKARSVEEGFTDLRRVRKIVTHAFPSRFIMKEDLLNLPIGVHLVLNGGIPVLQDLETKALNNPGFDPEAKAVLKKRERLSKWFNFKDSYREIMQVLKNNGSIMIYGEATRVHGEKMGHISLKFIERMAKGNVHLIPVGSRLENKRMTICYGSPCDSADLRSKIAELSGIPDSSFIA